MRVEAARRDNAFGPVLASSVSDLASLPDDLLLRRLADLVSGSRRIEADLVAHIGEVEDRRLYAREAVRSMFAYCTRILHLSEHEAYVRITAARAARNHPALLTMLADGRLHLSGIAKLVPHLTRENREGLLARATHKTKREIEELVAEIAPGPDVRSVVRKLPARNVAHAVAATAATMPALAPLKPCGGLQFDQALGPDRESSAAPLVTDQQAAAARPVTVEPLAPARYKVLFTASGEFCRSWSGSRT